MADKENKTEEPTAKRVREARQEGQVPLSKDLISVAVMWAGAVMLVADPGGTRAGLLNSTRLLLGRIDQLKLMESDYWLVPILGAAISVVIPVGALAMLAAFVTGFLQTKGLVTFKVMQPKLKKFNPLPQLKNMFFSAQAAVQLFLSLGKVAVVSLVTYLVLADEFGKFPGLVAFGLEETLSYMMLTTIKLSWRIGLLLLLFALIELMWKRYKTHEDMKMEKQEVKDEHKQQEGDPQVKSRQRGKMRQVNRNLIAKVSEASVVIVNPTHYSVALHYDLGGAGAPRVVAKGKNVVAARIREIARKAGVPIVHNPPLTRQIFAECDEGAEIGPQHYGAVAQVLAVIFKRGAGGQ